MAVPVVLLPLAALLGLAIGSSLDVVFRRGSGGGPPVRRYPLVEAVTGVAFVAVTALVGVSWVLPAVLYLTAVAVALALIDLDVRRLPDAIVLPSYPVIAALLALASWNPGGGSDWGALLRAGIGGAGLLAFYLATALIHPAGMGLGDVKLAGVPRMVLAWFGWGALAVGASAAFLLGALFSVGLMVTGRAGRTSGIGVRAVDAARGVRRDRRRRALAGWYLGLLG